MIKLFIYLLFLSSFSLAGTVKGKVVSVTDGDTITLWTGKLNIKVRLQGIDAPEMGQDFGKASKKILSDKIFNKEVIVYTQEKPDRYGRYVGSIEYEERSISYEMIKEGYAWHYSKYDNNPKWAEAEKHASKNKLGLWSQQNPINPDLWRAGKKTGFTKDGDTKSLKATQKEGVNYTHWLNTESNKRHNRGCRYFGKTGEGRPCPSNEGSPCGICKG